MVAKKHKLPIGGFPKEAKVVFQNGYFFVKANRGTVPHNRVGVVVGKWLAKSAVKRNCIKRMIYGFFQLKRGEFFLHRPVGKSIDLLIVAKPPIINVAKNELHHALEKLYERFV